LRRKRELKSVFFPSTIFNDKLIRDYESQGVAMPNMCVVAKQINIKKRNTSHKPLLAEGQEISESDGEYWILNLSKEDLVNKLHESWLGSSN